MQAGHEIVGQERAVAGRARDPFDVGRMRGRPVEPRQYAGQRPGKVRHAVRDHRQAIAGEPCRIAVGVENDVRAGRPQPRQHAVQDGDAADRDQRLVAAPHAAREAAGKDEAESRRIGR